MTIEDSFGRICESCGDRFVSGHFAGRNLCCKCWVKDGNPPATYHEGCLAASGDLCVAGHDKCFSNTLLTSFPAYRPWVCRRCGVKGADKDGQFRDPDEYDKIVEQFSQPKPPTEEFKAAAQLESETPTAAGGSILSHTQMSYRYEPESRPPVPPKPAFAPDPIIAEFCAAQAAERDAILKKMPYGQRMMAVFMQEMQNQIQLSEVNGSGVVNGEDLWAAVGREVERVVAETIERWSP